MIGRNDPRWALVLALLVLPAVSWAVDAAEPFLWLESEKPTRANIQARFGGWGHKDYLSEDSWLHFNLSAEEASGKLPPGGALLEYDFTVGQPGRYEVWNRVGFEFARSPFAWRIDTGTWQTISPDLLTTDLMELDFWCEVAWLKMGEADLAAGKHTLHIRPLRSVKEEKKRGPDGREKVEQILGGVNYASDCLCLYRGHFRPNGKHKPDAPWQTAEDQKAGRHVFELPAPPGNPGERTALSLAGPWQVCRYDEQEVVDRDGPTRTLPDRDQAFWKAIPVPGDKFKVKPELGFCHRFVYRTQVKVPADFAGRSFVLRFPSLNMIASLYVNGRFCGWTKAMYALWECDVTAALRPGEVNEICLVVKDAYYAFSPKKTGKSCRMSFNSPTSWIGDKNWLFQSFDFPIGSGYAAQAGILETPTLYVAGGVYASDVFAQPSVRKKQLGLEVTLFNSAPTNRNVRLTAHIVPVKGGPAEKTFAPREVTVPAGREVVVLLTKPWANPRLWWPDAPNLYQAVTEVSLDGKLIDVRKTTFGFREWEWNGPQFRLNGVPWQMWADTTQGDGGQNPRAAIAAWRANGNNMMRFWSERFGGLDREQALSLMDAEGIPVRLSGIFDGEGANYLGGLVATEKVNGKDVTVAFKDLFDNWITQLKSWVKAYRNHPSVFIWSIENEVTFINSRNLGLSQYVEPEIARAARAVMALDPTRPAMADGGNCLMDKSLPVNGVHYTESYWRDYPDEAYTLAKAYAAHEKALLPTWGKCPWQLMPDRPAFMGESYYLRGSKPGDFALFGGEGCFAGWSEHTRRGAGLYAKMLAEGYRWQGVAAHHFWLNGEDAGGLHYNSWKPVCLFCREWNWTFGANREIGRTLKVFNDTHYEDPIEASWELRLDGKKVAGETRSFRLAPGQHEEYQVVFRTPTVSQRTLGEFLLTCRRGDKEVFREVKPVAVIDAEAGPRPNLKAEELIVLDPFGSVTARLRARGLAFTEVKRTVEIPRTARVVVLGKDALNAREATDPSWLSLAGRGARVLALEQAYPLHYLSVPADLTPTDHVGRIAFAENLSHPAFAGLDQPDFFTWSKDHIVYRNAYLKATRGAVSLAQCDEQLNCSALVECSVNDGLMLLCQFVAGEKLAFDPVAQRLFDNLLAHAASYAPIHRQTAVVMNEAAPAAKLLAESGLKYDRAADLVETLAGNRYHIVIFEATPANLKRLADAADQVKAYTARGGWLMAWGLTPEGLASFNRLVGVEHVLRPFELERVTLPVVRDPLLAGLTGRDVALESNETIFPWAGDKYMVDDEFTWLVDFDDIAPFCEFPGAKAGDHQAARQAGPGWSRNVVNGFTSADAWKLIHYMSMPAPRLTLRLPREEEVTDFGIILNIHYARATRVNLYFDEDKTPVSLTTKPNGERQDFSLTPRKARKLTIELAQFDNPGVTTGIDNLWISVKRSQEWRSKVKPLLNVGGLVKYPMGPGGLVLNQLQIKPAEPLPENVQKKRAIVAALLRNLHATFSGGRVLTLGELAYRPLPLHDQCNQFLSRERGWLDGSRDLSHLPVGQQQFAGVTYNLRDFKTSPVPACVMLAGPGARGRLPNEVKGLKVGGRADVIFFLHAFHRVRELATAARGRSDAAGRLPLRRPLRRRQDGRCSRALRRRSGPLADEGADGFEECGRGLGRAVFGRFLGRASSRLPDAVAQSSARC